MKNIREHIIFKNIKTIFIKNFHRKNKLSLLFSSILMALLVLIMYHTKLIKEQKEEHYVSVDLEILPLEKEIVVEENKISRTIKTHLAYNQVSKNKFKETEPFKTLKELEAEAKQKRAIQNPVLEENNKQSSTTKKGYIKEIIENIKAKQTLYNQSEKVSANKENSSNKNTSAYYSLVGRNEVELPIPMYTCEVYGKMVVNITVNASGEVTTATINTKSSSSSNGCLVENAIAYAFKAKFNNSSKTSQIGTITYFFQAK